MKKQIEQKNVDTTLEEIKEVIDSPAGESLKKYLLKEIIRYRDIINIQEYSSAVATALEVKANKRVSQILDRIFADLMTWSEQDIQDTKEGNDFGV